MGLFGGRGRGGEGEELETLVDGVDVGVEGEEVEEGPAYGEEGADGLVVEVFRGREEDEEEWDGDDDADGDVDGGAVAHGFWVLVMGFRLYGIFGGMW